MENPEVNEALLYLKRQQAAAYLNISVATLARWASQGIGPAYFKLAGSTRYHRSDLEAFLAERRKGATATVDAAR
jgi:excisionase family DNA binding protein